jgi:hypothetical protein
MQKPGTAAQSRQEGQIRTGGQELPELKLALQNLTHLVIFITPLRHLIGQPRTPAPLLLQLRRAVLGLCLCALQRMLGRLCLALPGR